MSEVVEMQSENQVTLFPEVGGDVQRREPRLPAQLPQVDVAGGEAVDQLQVAVLGGDVDRGVAHLESSREVHSVGRPGAETK